MSPIPTTRYSPVVLLILDGWGIAEPSPGNAVSLADTPVMKRLEEEYFATTLQAAGEAVGLDWGEMGNSEVGHMNMGAGFTVYQDVVMINSAIRDGTFFQNESFLAAIEHVKKNNSNLHIMGLDSPGKVHSYNEHLYALLDLLKDKDLDNVYIHAWLDGRDVPPNTAEGYIAELEKKIETVGVGQIDTIGGRYYAMDRDERWERVQLAYDAMVFGKGPKYKSAGAAIKDAYKKKLPDDKIPPCVIDSPEKPYVPIKNNDAIIFINYRSDRARQISQAFMLPSFDKFDRQNGLQGVYFVAMTDYGVNLPIQIAFPKQTIDYPLAHIVSELKMKQLHAAETEKFAHVTSFFDGGNTEPYEGEEFLLVHSRKDVSDYDQVPEMSAIPLTDQLINKLETGKYDFAVVNYANPDMVAHTGDLEAVKQALKFVDTCVGRVVDSVLKLGGAVVITADHGNAERLRDTQTGEILKEHTANPVPLLVVAKGYEQKTYQPGSIQMGFIPGVPYGVLQDVAPTLLYLMEIEKPDFMTGRSLVD
ncbi:2,3-bisphosphoglycerate-independent phosphoglycerate mutase [Patescibacteria group bacterium]